MLTETEEEATHRCTEESKYHRLVPLHFGASNQRVVKDSVFPPVSRYNAAAFLRGRNA